MNFYDYEVPDHGESFESFLRHKNIEIIRIVSSDTLEAKEYSQKEDEWVLLLEGSATLEINGEEKSLMRGETLLIPAHTPHKVLHTDAGTLWLAVHLSPCPNG